MSRTLTFVVGVALDTAIQAVRATDLPYTYRTGCPVAPSGLRRLTVNQIGFDGKYYRGELIVRDLVVTDLTSVLQRAFDAKFPTRRMERVDVHRGSDERSMAADNTSAFNCRHVTGNPARLSQHSYGDAVDINTVENPYVTASRVYPPGSRSYLNRSRYRTGMILPGGSVAKSVAARRWYWGARWKNPDYQHFSKNGK